MINARTRKTVTDFKGGWYPSLLDVYVQYLKRGLLPSSNPLHSNGYTFENLYGFLSKYNSFFQRFVDELLAATIILKKSGLLVRNTVFTKQKFTYKRGVNFDFHVNYLGDDGSVFMVLQPVAPPAATIPIVTTTAITNITQTGATGGGNVISNGGATVYQRGICWDISPSPQIGNSHTTQTGDVGAFISSLTGLSPNTTYYVRAYAINSIGIGYGNEISFTTAAPVILPVILTKLAGSVTQTAINNTGGYGITGYTGIDYYAMQYSANTTGGWVLSPALPIAGPLAVNNFTSSITGLTPDKDYLYRAYMVVSGSPFYGNILTIHTPAIVPVLPTVTTNPMNTIGQIVATGGGNVSGGTYTIISRGLAYGFAPSPTTGGTHTVDGSGFGTFTSSLSGLVANTTYYVRAYATTNGGGTVYGSQITFTTLPLPTVNLPLVRISHLGTGPGQQSTGTIIPSPALSAGQCITVNINISHVVFACNQTGGQNVTTIYCCSGGVWNIVSPSPYITGAPAVGPPARCCGAFTLSVTIHPNEKLCYFNQVASNSCCACGTCSYIYLPFASSTPDICVITSGSDTLSV